MITRQRLTRGVAALSILAAFAACSSSKPSSGGATTTASSATGSSSTSAAETTGTPIKVGLICDCSGPFGADIAPSGQVAKAWANTVNASGGLSGHPIQLTVLDDASTPGNSSTDVQTLMSNHVDVIIDNSNFDAVWASTVATAGIPVVGGNISSEPFFTNADFYPSGETTDSITYADVSVAKAAGAKSLGDLYCAEAAVCQQGVPLIEAAAKQVGLSASYSASISATAPNYTAQCVAAQQQHVGALFIGDAAAVIAKVGQNCSQQGYNPIYITEGTGYSDQLGSAPGIKDNLWSDYPILPYWDNAAPVQAMNAALDKYYPGIRTHVSSWSEFAVQTWTAGLLIQDAVKNSGLAASDAPTPAALKKGLDAVHGDNLDGWSPTLNFTAGQPHKVDCWFVARVQSGTPSLINGGQLSCQNGASA